jgi:hypothetical protein
VLTQFLAFIEGEKCNIAGFLFENTFAYNAVACVFNIFFKIYDCAVIEIAHFG